MRIYLVSEAGNPRYALHRLCGHSDVLTSVLGVGGPAAERDLIETGPSAIVDSGVFTFMFGAQEKRLPPTYEAFRDYTEQYLEKLDRIGFRGTVVEVDAQRIIGTEETYRLRELFKPLGDRVMYVWHYPDGMDGLARLAREQSYVAIGMPELRHVLKANGRLRNLRAAVSDLVQRIHLACDGRPPRIHLLGCTALSMIRTGAAYSCDSSAWLTGPQYGDAWIFDFAKGRPVHVPIRSKLFAAWRQSVIESAPRDVLRFIDGVSMSTEYLLNSLACARAFHVYQEWLNERVQPGLFRGAGLPGGAL